MPARKKYDPAATLTLQKPDNDGQQVNIRYIRNVFLSKGKVLAGTVDAVSWETARALIKKNLAEFV